MKLPDMFETWFEFASHAISHYPESNLIYFFEKDKNEVEYKTDLIKSKAFDEIIADLDFTRNDVAKFKNVAMCTGYFTDDKSSETLKNMTDLLWKLSQ